MLDRVAYRHAKRKQQDLSDSEKGSTEHNVADGPPVFQRPEDEDELGNDVNNDADERPQDVNDP